MIIEFEGKKPQIAEDVFIAPTATLIGDVIVETGASIWFGAVLRGDFGRMIVRKGRSVQDNIVVHVIPECETVIGENATVAHGAILHGCTIEKGAIVGMGSIVQDFCVIGEEAMIAAGSVVPTNMKVPPRHLAAGVPAQVKKEIAGASLMWVMQSAPMYQEL
ncbi:MAG: gamma carbonic anhydrase family protein, partial [Clostridia bacterium]|nr:gamma carbonic anhydrase family protein [Clostridia bacterium]